MITKKLLLLLSAIFTAASAASASDPSPPTCTALDPTACTSISHILQVTCSLDPDSADHLEAGLMRFGVSTADDLKGVDDFLIESAAFDGHSSLPDTIVFKVQECFEANFGSDGERLNSDLHDDCAYAGALLMLGEELAETGQCAHAIRTLEKAAEYSKKCPEIAADAIWELFQAKMSCTGTDQDRSADPLPTGNGCAEFFPKIQGVKEIADDFQILLSSGPSKNIHWTAWYTLFSVDEGNCCDARKASVAWRKLSITCHPDKQDKSVPGAVDCATEAMMIVSAGKEALIERSPCARKKARSEKKKRRKKSKEEEDAEEFSKGGVGRIAPPDGRIAPPEEKLFDDEA